MSVVVLISNEEEIESLIRWGCHFATARHLDLSVIYAKHSKKRADQEEINIDESLTSEDSLIRTVCTLLVSVKQDFEYGPNPHGESESFSCALPRFKTIDGKHLLPIIKSELKSLDANLFILGQQIQQRSDRELSALVKQLLYKAPCDTMLIRPGESRGRECKRILVPAAGGPHSKVALKWTSQVTEKNNGCLTALYIEANMGYEAEEVGEVVLNRILNETGISSSDILEKKIIVADNVQKGIAEAAKDGYDLVLVGATDHGFVSRILFGTIQKALLQGPNAVAIGTMRSARPMVTRLREDIEDWLDLKVPQMDRQSRIGLLDRLQTGAMWNFDFMAMMCFSTSIASFGLIQSSAAVVIGAMLVAPLMMPLIAAGMALVQGNIPLIKESTRSIIYGFMLALIIGIFCGLISPLRELTTEMQARGSPNLFDLAVAFISGSAAAYAMSQPNLSASLPGVAIAAALVPPLATTGISLSFGEIHIAKGAATLFATNVVAIILGASTVFYACGVRGNREFGQRRLWSRRIIFGLALCSVVLAIPLASVLITHVAPDESITIEISDDMLTDLEARVGVSANGTITKSFILMAEDPIVLSLNINAASIPDQTVIGQLGEVALKHLKQPVRIRVETKLVSEAVVE